MINGVRFKVCGLTSLADAAAADACGADYLGFIFYQKSPRYISLESYHAMSAHLPHKPRVAVTVEPTTEEIIRLKAEGFDFFQFHFPHDTELSRVEHWSELITPNKLWLAPRVPPGEHLEPAMLALANTFLYDTYRAGTYGGTGQAGDWTRYKQLQKDHPRINWILAGGLTPENAVAALTETGARTIDVNSGVESVPGIKSAEKLKRLAQVLSTYKGALSRSPF
ncbi:MAG: phosphoribosylanthranilate isomerase [Verrucomicrobia bacterium]|nr:phosphoribosylanthranilate isomerase [Verrucomicrobiota bacterium]